MKILETQYGEDFVGREYDIEEGKKKIRENGVVVLTGNRGIGKTNLMRVLEDFFKQERECHYIESGSLFSTEMSRYFLPEQVPTGASHSATLLGVGGGAGRSWSPREETILEGMEKSSEMIIFVGDAHKLNNEEMDIIFAGTGRNNKLKFVLEIAKPYYPDADLKITPEQLVELGKLGDSDIGKIVEKECPDFTDEIVKRIVSLSDGYPYIARSLSYICEKKESEDDMLVFLNTLKDKDMEHTLNSIHKGVLITLEENARGIIKKLAIAPPVLTLPLIVAFCGGDADTSLAEVIERGILRENGERYSIYHPLFRDYLQKIQRVSLKYKKKIYSEAMENVKMEPDSFYLLLEVLNENDIFNELVEIVENYDALNSIGEQSYLWSKISEAALAWHRLLKLAEETKNKNWISVATGNMGIIYGIYGDLEKALKYYEKALKIHEDIENEEGMANQFGNIGVIYARQGNLNKAIEHFEKGFEIHQGMKNKEGMANQLGNIGNVNQIQNKYNEALKNYNESLKIHLLTGNRRGIGRDYSNIGIVYQQQEELKKALEYYEKALKIYEVIGNQHGVANNYGNMGIVHKMQGDMENALKHYEIALKIHTEIENKEGVANQLGNMGAVYGGQGDLTKALIHLEKALQFFNDIGNKLNEASTLMNIGNIFINQGDKATALNYYMDAQDIAMDYSPHLFEEISEKVNRLIAMQ